MGVEKIGVLKARYFCTGVVKCQIGITPFGPFIKCRMFKMRELA